jgi:hypothetical protein
MSLLYTFIIGVWILLPPATIFFILRSIFRL